MPLPFAPPLEPMLAEAQPEIPKGEGWVYEPKWDGFRTIIFVDGGSVHLCSRGGKPMQRYFPEVVERFQTKLPKDAIYDGELIIAGQRGLEFETLQMRIHPAASRVNKLSKEFPASFVAFDLLALGTEDLRQRPFSERRALLLENFPAEADLFPTPQTKDPAVAETWFHDFEGAGLDGVIARRQELPYVPGERVMVKVKHGRTADCVVAGYRDGKTPGTVGSLLLGMYDEAGTLHHVGHTSSFTQKEKKALVEKLQPYLGGEGFSPGGRMLGGPSRWNGGEEKPWTPLRPELVVEVKFDYLQGDRFRHGATFVRWRVDREPKSCNFAQLLPPRPFSLDHIVQLARQKAP
jgi:ATP-dependent DNA ligase